MAMVELGLIGTTAGKKSKLELDRARFKVGWDRMAKGVNGGARGATNWAMVTYPCWI